MAVLVVFYEGESKDDMKAVTATANPDIISKMAVVIVRRCGRSGRLQMWKRATADLCWCPVLTR